MTERLGSAIAELHRISGFTWEQLARLFKVSRRSFHFWASGKAMTSANEEHLQRLLSAIRKVDRGSAAANRAVLLAVRDDGNIPFDLLAEGQYDRVSAFIGPGLSQPRTPLVPSTEAKAARVPRSPAKIVDARQERIHVEKGRLLAAKKLM